MHGIFTKSSTSSSCEERVQVRGNQLTRIRNLTFNTRPQVFTIKSLKRRNKQNARSAMEWVSIAENLWKDFKDNNPRYRIGKVSLPLKQRVCLSVGHVFSDLCCIVWSAFLLIYFNKVVGLSSSSVGYLFVVAQCSDALLTPFIEIGIDRLLPRVSPSYGKKKLWHLFGTVVVFLTLPLIFSSCLVCYSDSPPSAILGYYSSVIVVFHVGWSIVRISHLSLVPDVVQRRDELVEVNAIRSWLSFVCGMIVLSITWIVLGQAEGMNITPALERQFTTLSLLIVGFGLVLSFLFHWGTIEPPTNKRRSQRGILGNMKVVHHKASSRDLYVFRRHTESSMDCLRQQEEFGSSCRNIEGGGDQANEDAARSWRQWFSDSSFYKVAVVYMCSRVVASILQLYIVFYVTDTLRFSKEAMVYFPLALLITDVVANTMVTTIRKALGNKWTFCGASVLVFQSCVWFQLQTQASQNFVFLSAILFGGSSSIMLATSLSLLTDLVKKDKQGSSGFVFSTMGFFDKLLVGLVVLIIQRNYPDTLNGAGCLGCADSARLVITVTTSVFTAIAFLVVIFTFKSSVIISCKRSVNRENKDEQCTQTDFLSAPKVKAIDNIYTINEGNDDVTTTQESDGLKSRDKCDVTDIVQSRDTRCPSAPALSMRRSFSFPVASSKSPSTHRLSIPECQTVEGVSLAVEKVVVFSFDSLVAADLLSISERTSSLPHIVDRSKKDVREKSSENIYQGISLLNSTEL